MSQNDFDFNERNELLIQELMEIVGVADCDELPEKVRSLKRDAELHVHPTTEQNGACHELHWQWMKLYNFCPECGADVRPVQNRSDGG